MSAKNWFLAIVDAVLWFFFIYYLLYTIKNPVDLWLSALVLLALGYIATIACPWFRSTSGWRRMWRKEE